MKKIGLFLTLAAALQMTAGVAFAQGQDLAMQAYKLRMNGDPHAALAFLDSALLAHPDEARIWFEKGRCMEWIKTEGCRKFTDSWKYLAPRLKVSRRCFNRAIHLDPDNSRYHYWASENAALRGMVGFYSPWKWPAVPFIMRRSVKEAATAVRLNPENLDYRYALVNYSRFGTLFGGSKKLALAHADILESLDPVYGAMAFEELGSKKHPYDAFSRYLELEPKYPEHLKLLYQLAVYYAGKDSTFTDKALYYFKKILEIDPGNSPALTQLYREMPKDRKDEALPFIQAYLGHVDSGYNYYKSMGQNLLGQYYQQKRNVDKAKVCFAEAGRLNPNSNGTSSIDLDPPAK